MGSQDGRGPQTDKTPAAKSLYRSIFSRQRYLAMLSISLIFYGAWQDFSAFTSQVEFSHRVLKAFQRTRLSCGRMVWLLAHPLPPASCLSSSVFRIVGGGGGGGKAHDGEITRLLKHFLHESGRRQDKNSTVLTMAEHIRQVWKAWSSRTHSILYDGFCPLAILRIKQFF